MSATGLFPFDGKGTVCVDINRVNIEDVILCGQGKQQIIRCEGNPHECILWLQPPLDELERVAGMVSENV